MCALQRYSARVEVPGYLYQVVAKDVLDNTDPTRSEQGQVALHEVELTTPGAHTVWVLAYVRHFEQWGEGTVYPI